MSAADHQACKVGKCIHGHIDYCPAQKKFKKPRARKAAATRGMVLDLTRDADGLNIQYQTELARVDGSYVGTRYIFEARNQAGEQILLKAAAAMLRRYSPEIADAITEIGKESK